MKYAFLMLAPALALCSCSSVANLPTLSLTPAQAVYRLGTGDELKITVFGEQRLTGSYAINGEGMVSLPLIGNVLARDKTIAEFQEAVRSQLADGFLNNPSVSVDVANYRPYYVLGEVSKPGEFAYADSLTVYSAVARAGGFTYRADNRRVFIRHKAQDREVLYRLEGATPVQPGDTIRIGERAF